MNRQWCRVGVALDGWVLLCCLVAGLVCGPLLPVPVAAQGGFIMLCQRSCWLRGVNVVVPHVVPYVKGAHCFSGQLVVGCCVHCVVLGRRAESPSKASV